MSSTPTPTPHDALFRDVLGLPEHARGALRAVIPAAVADALDWTTLARSPGSFIDPELIGSHTDLLFTIAWQSGGETLVYVLFEHQSSPDGWMAFRLLRYLVRIWERWRAENPRRRALPVIIPVVLYHGAEPWSVPLTFDALFEIPRAVRPALAPHLVQLSYLLDDLSEVPDDHLRGRAMTALGRLVEICFKHARTQPDLIALLERWADVVRDVVHAPHGLEALAKVMRYIVLVSGHVNRNELQAFLDRVVGAEAKDTIMTIGEELIEQGERRGVQKGLQQGREEGRQEGRQEGTRGALLGLLRKRFGAQVTTDVEQRLEAASAEQIALWLDRVLDAATLDEILAK